MGASASPTVPLGLRPEPQEGLGHSASVSLRGEPFTVLSLFAGIGGFDLGLERTGGFKTVAFCEINPFRRKVLAKHWPGVPIYDDIRDLTAAKLGNLPLRRTVIVGGFPCQDISSSGRRAGIEGERSGLWSEYARLIGELRPCYVIVENVADLVARGLGTVLGDLAALGYDAWWDCIRAADVGAPHLRPRIWIIAYPRSEQHEGHSFAIGRAVAAELAGTSSYPEGVRLEEQRIPEEGRKVVAQPSGRGGGCDDAGRQGQWATEPALGRVAHGVPDRVDRLSAIGDAVVPQIPELIGRAILACDSGSGLCSRPAGARPEGPQSGDSVAGASPALNIHRTKTSSGEESIHATALADERQRDHV